MRRGRVGHRGDERFAVRLAEKMCAREHDLNPVSTTEEPRGQKILFRPETGAEFAGVVRGKIDVVDLDDNAGGKPGQETEKEKRHVTAGKGAVAAIEKNHIARLGEFEYPGDDMFKTVAVHFIAEAGDGRARLGIE